MRKNIFVLTLFMLSVCFTYAQSKEITVAFAPVPPYVMQNEKGEYSGLEYEIVKEALSVRGYKIIPSSYPLARVIETVKSARVDAGVRILPSHDTGKYLSDIYITFNNIALGIAGKNLKISTISDLAGKRMVAFQRATIVLGPDFLAAAQNNQNYFEVADQVQQIQMLFADRVDLAIGEARIMNHFIHSPQTNVNSKIPVVEYRIFPETPYRVAFVNEQHLKDFNYGLAEIKKNGTYDAIIKKYSSR